MRIWDWHRLQRPVNCIRSGPSEVTLRLDARPRCGKGEGGKTAVPIYGAVPAAEWPLIVDVDSLHLVPGRQGPAPLEQVVGATNPDVPEDLRATADPTCCQAEEPNALCFPSELLLRPWTRKRVVQLRCASVATQVVPLGYQAREGLHC